MKRLHRETIMKKRLKTLPCPFSMSELFRCLQAAVLPLRPSRLQGMRQLSSFLAIAVSESLSPSSSYKPPNPGHADNIVPALKYSFLGPYLPETGHLAHVAFFTLLLSSLLLTDSVLLPPLNSLISSPLRLFSSAPS